MPMGLEDQFRTMYEDRMIERLPLIKNPDYLTSGTRLLDAHKQVAEVDEALRTKAKEFETKMEVLKLRKSLVEQKDLQLKKTLEKFEKYLMENDSKRARAEKKYGDEKELTIVKDKEILRLLKDSEKLTAQRNVLLYSTKNHRIYYRYMLRVQGVTDEYNELRDIIARYETLYATHQELIYQQQISIDLTESMKNELKIYEEEKQSEKIRHTLKLIELQNHMEKVKNIAFRNEMMLAEVTGLVNQQNSNLGTMLLSIENIRDLMIMFYGRKLVEDQMTVQEAIRILPAIGEFVRFMSDVVAMVKKEMSSILPPPTGCKSPPRNSNEATVSQTYKLASN